MNPKEVNILSIEDIITLFTNTLALFLLMLKSHTTNRFKLKKNKIAKYSQSWRFGAKKFCTKYVRLTAINKAIVLFFKKGFILMWLLWIRYKKSKKLQPKYRLLFPLGLNYSLNHQYFYQGIIRQQSQQFLA